jgi:hypothetical protein
MKKLLVLTMVLVSANSFALTSRLAFQVRSSGPDAFPCNAGIKHGLTTSTDGYRFVKETNCSGGNCVSGFETETGVHGGYDYNSNDNSTAYVPSYGIYLPDLFKFHVKKYNPTSGFESVVGGTIKATTSGWRSIVNSDQALGSVVGAGDLHRVVESNIRKNNVLSDLVFLFSTEQYGTEYFVDICNYQPETYCGSEDCSVSGADMNVADASYWQFDAFTSGKSESVLDYINLSGLQVRAILFCDGSPVGEPTAWITAKQNIFHILSANLGTVPAKKCVTRFEFKETLLEQMRKNQLQDACFEVETVIDEAAL